MLQLLTDPNAWAALITLTALEIVLGIDNLVFISVLVGRLEKNAARRARQIGLSLAFVFRVILLAGLTWIMRLTKPWFTIGPQEISGRDVILLVGGMFLLWKSTREIHERLEGAEESAAREAKGKADSQQLDFQRSFVELRPNIKPPADSESVEASHICGNSRLSENDQGRRCGSPQYSVRENTRGLNVSVGCCPVPEGPLIVARRFNAGQRTRISRVP